MNRIIMSTPALRAHHFEKHLAWARLLVPEVERRIGKKGGSPSLRANTLVQIALACLDVTLAEWVAQDGAIEFGELLDSCWTPSSTTPRNAEHILRVCRATAQLTKPDLI